MEGAFVVIIYKLALLLDNVNYYHKNIYAAKIRHYAALADCWRKIIVQFALKNKLDVIKSTWRHMYKDLNRSFFYISFMVMVRNLFSGEQL